MRRQFKTIMSGNSVRLRALRASAFTIIGFGGKTGLRIVSNMILTRLLFPEAFGLMALVQVFMTGLAMFSDIGIRTSILQNKEGDDPEFLNTAWTLQILRGICLWLAACALALPVAHLYDEPMLAQLLPVVGFTAVISGFSTTKGAAMHRHLQVGRETMIALGVQAVGILITASLAYVFRSVWALVVGGLISTALSVILYHFLLPGHSNRLIWNPKTIGTFIRFGKYIFLSTIAGFLINQGDRAILGAYIPIGQLGIYTIGALIGTMPLLLSRNMNGKIVLPLYRMKPPQESEQNRRQIRRARFLMVSFSMLMSVPIAYFGISLIELLYDPRYHMAGPIAVLFSLAILPQIIFNGYPDILLANGDSRRYFLLMAFTAALQLTFMFIGVTWWGIGGAILASPIAALLASLLRIRFIARYQANEIPMDLMFLAIGLTVNGWACWLHRAEILALLQ